VVDVPPPVVNARTVAMTGVAIGAVVGLAYLSRRRGADERYERALPAADISRESDDVSLTAVTLGTDLATADGGYDGTAVATPSTVDLR
jgi:hypothetical protein